MKGSKAVFSLLEKEGVEVMFGYPGGQSLQLYDDLIDSSIRHVLVRHEQCAAHMADGFARATGKVGVCTSTSGPGATNLVTGVATAYVDSSPMMVLTGQVPTTALGNQAFQEADSFSIMMPITKHNFRILDPSDIPVAVRRGMNIASSGRKGPVHIDLPSDIQKMEVPEEAFKRTYRTPTAIEDFSKIPEAVKILSEAEKPLLLVGGGAVWAGAGPEIMKLSEFLMAPVATTIMAKGIIPETHPLSLGIIGMHGKVGARKAYLEADAILAVGTRFSDRTAGAQSGLSPSTKLIQIDIDPAEASKLARTQIRLVGDAKKGVASILNGLSLQKKESAWTRRIKEIQDACNCNINIMSAPILPQKVIHDLNETLDKGAIVTTDVGQNQMWVAHFLKTQNPRQFISSGGFGTMGFGLPAAMGAKCAFPDETVICITGDGGIQMVFQEFATAVSENLPVVVCVFNNGWLGMVKQWQKLFNDKRYSGTHLTGNPDFVKLAQAYGADGICVEKPSEIREALQTGYRSGVPYLIDIRIDPEEDVLPMIPPGDGPATIIQGRCTWN